MYCQHCGSESHVDLNYCKRCGGNLGAGASLAAAPETRPAISTGAAMAVGGSTLLLVIVGLLVLLVGVSEMMRQPVPPDVLKMIVVFGALTILGSVACLTYLWAYLLGGARRAHSSGGSSHGPAPLKSSTAAGELGAARMDALPERPASVVEHTTRTLEHARKR